MKNVYILLSIFFWTSANAQFIVVSGDEFEIEVPKNVKSYSIYCHSTSLGWQELYKGQRILQKTVLVTDGHETKITEFEGNKTHRIQYNYFNKGLLQKAVVKYINPTSNEIFYYKYDTISNDPIDVKGYKDGKLIYTESRSLYMDTLEIKKHYINVDGIKAKERELIYYSNDKLTRTQVDFRDNLPDKQYLITKYNSLHKIIEEIDSSSDNYSKTTYQYGIDSILISKTTFSKDELSVCSFIYDLNGRLKEEMNNINGKETFYIKHDTSLRESITTKYQSKSNGQKDTLSLVTKRFDTQGNLIFEEKVKYDDTGLGTSYIPMNTSTRYWIYENRRVIKYIYRHIDGGPIITYDVTYKD